MFYAERIHNWGEPDEEVEQGVFMSIEEFVEYRLLGWSGTKATDAAADALIAQQEKRLGSE